MDRRQSPAVRHYHPERTLLLGDQAERLYARSPPALREAAWAAVKREADAMRLAATVTPTLVPCVYDVAIFPRWFARLRGRPESFPAGVVLMSYMEGDMLQEKWFSLSNDEKIQVAVEVEAAVLSWRERLKPPSDRSFAICSVDGGPCSDAYIRDLVAEHKSSIPDLSPPHARLFGPLKDENQFWELINRFIASRRDGLNEDARKDGSLECPPLVLQPPARPRPTVFTHGDLRPHNILIKDGRLAAVIDFGEAGFRPDWFESHRAGCYWGVHRDPGHYLDFDVAAYGHRPTPIPYPRNQYPQSVMYDWRFLIDSSRLMSPVAWRAVHEASRGNRFLSGGFVCQGPTF